MGPIVVAGGLWGAGRAGGGRAGPRRPPDRRGGRGGGPEPGDAGPPPPEHGRRGDRAAIREARRLGHRHQPPGQPDGDGNEGAEQPKDGRAGGHRSDRDYLPGRTGRTTVYPANSTSSPPTSSRTRRPLGSSAASDCSDTNPWKRTADPPAPRGNRAAR